MLRIELSCVASNVPYYMLFMFSFLPQSTNTAIEKYNAIFTMQYLHIRPALQLGFSAISELKFQTVITYLMPTD